MSLTQLSMILMLSLITLTSCYRELSMIRPGKALVTEESLFQHILENVGELRLSGKCGVSETKAPFLRIVFGTKRPFWRNSDGHVLIQTLTTSAHGMIRNNKFEVTGIAPDGEKILYQGFFDNQKRELLIKMRTCTYAYQVRE